MSGVPLNGGDTMRSADFRLEREIDPRSYEAGLNIIYSLKPAVSEGYSFSDTADNGSRQIRNHLSVLTSNESIQDHPSQSASNSVSLHLNDGRDSNFADGLNSRVKYPETMSFYDNISSRRTKKPDLLTGVFEHQTTCENLANQSASNAPNFGHSSIKVSPNISKFDRRVEQIQLLRLPRSSVYGIENTSAEYTEERQRQIIPLVPKSPHDEADPRSNYRFNISCRTASRTHHTSATHVGLQPHHLSRPNMLACQSATPCSISTSNPPVEDPHQSVGQSSLVTGKAVPPLIEA